MKKILLLAFLINLCSFSFAQKTNSGGEYLVKTATWKSYGGLSSFKMDLEYHINGRLKEIVKTYAYNNKTYIETYSISHNLKGEKSLKYVAHA